MKNNSLYYSLAKAANESSSGHPGIKLLVALANKSSKVLDVGCGEGTRLYNLLGNRVGYGVDINKYAIKLAEEQYPNQRHLLYDGVQLPFKNHFFNLTYSNFVLEHTLKPQHFIDEMIRVTKKNGYVFILCPNFGAPNRRSPNSKERPLIKLLHGFLNDFSLSVFIHTERLNFKSVKPKKIFKNIDDDTTSEPYLFSLYKYLLSRADVTHLSSLWVLEPCSNSPRKNLFKTLGKYNVFPFKYWGPQLLIIAKVN